MMFLRVLLLVCIFIFNLGLHSSYAQITANFSSPNLEACGSLQTTFFDQSTSINSIISWSWDLGGNTSSKQNPGAIFTEPGQYTICLTVTDVDGNSDTECKENYITILPSPISAFEADNTEGCAPVHVNFTDLSTSENGPIASWLWDIGGSTGVVNTQDPNLSISSSYQNGGNYTASLTIEDSLGCTSTTTISNFITVFQILPPDISLDLVSTCQLPWQVQFVNNNIDPSVNYLWDFGNGTTHDGSSPPLVNYSEAGAYDIQLFMTNGECSDTLILENYINTTETANFSFSPVPTCQNTPIQFTDESVIQADSVLWVFGDGTTYNTANPNHVFEAVGCFDVSLIRYTSDCTDTATVSCIEILPSPEVDINIENQFNCTLPTTVILQGSAPESGSYFWEFTNENSMISADSNNVPIIIEDFGANLLNLTYTDQLGCVFTQDSIPIDIYPFEVNLPSLGPSGCAPLTFTLSDSISSQVDVITWEWTIGNPMIFSSDLSNPTFTLQDTGRYDVQLIAENINGCVDTIFIEDYIKVGMLPEVNFEAFPIEGCTVDDVQLIDLSSDYVDEWNWHFDTTSVSTEQNPIINFPNPGTFDVLLYASHYGCLDSLRIEDYINVLNPVSSFNIRYNCEDPYTVDIINGSLGADSLYWTLRLSETDSLIFTDSIFGSYTFPDRGIYTISHYSKSFESGCEHILTDTIKIVDPIASYTLDTLRGCAPLEINIGDFSQDAFQYEYLTDVGTIDSIFSSEPSIIFTEGGVVNGPLLIITDIHECKDSFQLMDSVFINQLDAAIDYPDVVCIPDDIELIDQSVDVLGNIISWEWNLGNGYYDSSNQDTSVYIDSVGKYDIFFKVKDDWECEDSLFIPMAINAVEIVPDFSSDTLGCTWAPISFSASVNSDFAESYAWDFGDGSSGMNKNTTHIYTEEGTYSVCLIVGDSRGCTKEICKENIVTIIDPKAEYSGDPIFATCPPLLSNFTNLSRDAISYIWNFGDNSGISENESPSHVYTSPGTFDVTLIAQSTSKCFDTLVIEDYVRVEGPSGDFIFDLASACIPISVDLFAQSDGFYSYTWDYGNGVLDSVPGLVIHDTTSIVYTETGKFTPKLIITDSVGCSRSFAGDPIIVNDVNLDFQKDLEPQCGPPLDVNLYNLSSGTTNEVEYTWIIEGPQNFSSINIPPIFTISESGLYTVNLIAQYDNCIDTLQKEDFLEIADIPDVSFEIQTDDFCENIDAHFLNTSSVEYGEFVDWFWDFGDGETSNIKNPTHQYSGQEGRTITLIGVTDKGCESQFSASFDVLPSMIGIAGEDHLICIGDEVELSGTVNNFLEGGSYFWVGENSLSCTQCLNPTVSPQITSQYIFVSIHPNGCESTDTLLVTVIPTPGPELTLTTDSIICLGSESTIIVDNFNPLYNYIWNSQIEGQDCYEDCEEVNVSPDTITTYEVTVYNEFGCFKSESVTIDVESSFIEFIPQVRAICEGESTTIEAIGGNNPMWSPDPDISCLTCSTIKVTPSTSKNYYLEVESDLGCSYSDSVHVIVVPDNSVNAGLDQEICLGELINLNAVGIGQPNWSPSEGITDTNGYSTTAQLESSGYIFLTMTYDECSQSDSLFVEVHTQANITAIGDSICAGEVGILTADGTADSYTWMNVNAINNHSNSIEISTEQTQMVQVIGSFRTCKPDTAEALLYVYPEIDYSLSENNYTLHLNDEIWIQPTYDSNRNYQYEWSPEIGLDCVECADPRIKGLMENMEYSLIVIDQNSGCKEEFLINVRFQNECTQNIFYLPNIIAPNSTDGNNIFKLSTNNPEEFISMTLYDRWGNQIFNSRDINIGWDGKFGSQKVESGVYVYKINLICPITNEEYVILGDVTVIY